MALDIAVAVDKVGWLGHVQRVHSIGPYDLVEFVQKEIINSTSNGKTFYAVTIDGKGTSSHFPTIDEALIFAIASRQLKEPNTARWFAHAATKLLLAEGDRTNA